MKICGVAAEFNPFHLGHRLLVDKIRESGGSVVAVMSGNFVQRGECAVLPKSERAQMAIKGGVDLVIELPAVYALGAAERFARGCTDILNACGVIDEMWFGSECGDIDILTECAKIIADESSEFKEMLTKNLADGMSFPAARAAAMGEKGSIVSSPNNILAVEYIGALLKSESKIRPVTIERQNAGYHNTDADTADYSASAARKLIYDGIIKTECKPLFMSDFDTAVAARIKTAVFDDLCTVADCNDEIAARLLKAVEFNTFAEITEAALCRRYTRGRIQRVICNAMLGNRFTQYVSPSYIRPLAFNENGAKILKEIKENSPLTVASRGAILKNDPVFQLECRATDLYSLIRGEKGGSEFTAIPVMVS